ncbi:cuticle collagen 19-like [Linepithema humile]|uniref:cuticle collagen 19-like n=1 Tax=Linepithema humile TaxID=83485 RepID=UPI00351DAFF8
MAFTYTNDGLARREPGEPWLQGGSTRPCRWDVGETERRESPGSRAGEPGPVGGKSEIPNAGRNPGSRAGEPGPVGGKSERPNAGRNPGSRAGEPGPVGGKSERPNAGRNPGSRAGEPGPVGGKSEQVYLGSTQRCGLVGYRIGTGLVMLAEPAYIPGSGLPPASIGRAVGAVPTLGRRMGASARGRHRRRAYVWSVARDDEW